MMVHDDSLLQPGWGEDHLLLQQKLLCHQKKKQLPATTLATANTASTEFSLGHKLCIRPGCCKVALPSSAAPLQGRGRGGGRRLSPSTSMAWNHGVVSAINIVQKYDLSRPLFSESRGTPPPPPQAPTGSKSERCEGSPSTPGRRR